MKKIFVFVICFYFFSCENNEKIIIKEQQKFGKDQRVASGVEFNMLWNKEGVTKRSFLHLNLNNGNVDLINNPPLRYLCDLSEADIVGNHHRTWPYVYLTTNGYIQSNDSTAPSFKLVSEGYDNHQFGGSGSNYSGFAIWVQNGYTNSPLVFRMINSAKQLSLDKKLREVGIVFEHWYNQFNEGRWSFKDQYYIEELSMIRPKFDIKINHFNNYRSPNTTITTTYLTADLRIEYYNIRNGNKVRTDLIGVIFSNLGGSSNGFDFNGNLNDNVFWEDTNPQNPRVILHGYQLGLGIPNIPIIPNNFTTIEFDYKPLIAQYLPQPPVGCKGVLVGFDVYSSTRCADIDFSIKNIYLNSKFY